MTRQKQLKSRFLKVILALLFLGACVAIGIVVLESPWGGSSRGNSSQSLNSALRQAPSFELPDAKGQKHQLEEFRGKAIILHFWASWCPPCLEEIPQWVGLGPLLKGKPVQMIAISLDSKWEEALKVLPAENLGENITSLLDSEGASSEAYGSFQFPETYLLSADLKIVTKLVGPQDWQSLNFLKMMDKVLSLRVQNFNLFQGFAHNVVHDKSFFLFTGGEVGAP